MFKYIKIKIDKNFKKIDFCEYLKDFSKDKNLLFMFTKGWIKYEYDQKMQGLCNSNSLKYDFNELEAVTLSDEAFSRIDEAKKYFYGFDEENPENNDEEVFQKITMDNTDFFLAKNDDQASMFIKIDNDPYAIITNKENILTNVFFIFEDDDFDFYWIAYTEESDFKEYINKTPALLKQVIE